MYQLVIERSAEKQLAKIPAPYFSRILKAIENLANDPRPADVKSLQGVLVLE